MLSCVNIYQFLSSSVPKSCMFFSAVNSAEKAYSYSWKLAWKHWIFQKQPRTYSYSSSWITTRRSSFWSVLQCHVTIIGGYLRTILTFWISKNQSCHRCGPSNAAIALEPGGFVLGQFDWFTHCTSLCEYYLILSTLVPKSCMFRLIQKHPCT